MLPSLEDNRPSFLARFPGVDVRIKSGKHIPLVDIDLKLPIVLFHQYANREGTGWAWGQGVRRSMSYPAGTDL